MPSSRQYREKPSIAKLISRPFSIVKVEFATSMSIVDPGFDINHSWVCSSTSIGNRPFFRELLRKMSAIPVLMIARIP